MSIFRTPLSVAKSSWAMTLEDRVLTTGSCFSDMLGEQLTKNKFTVSSNPSGIVYNPVSIHKVLSYAIGNKSPLPGTYVNSHGVVSNYDFHSSFSHQNLSDVEGKINEVIGSNHLFLKNCTYLLITYGTAFVYERNDTGDIVANCHKIPSSQFSKQLLNTESIVTSFDQFYQELKAFNPAIRIILTVSPVRHLKETMELNSVSKSTLRLASHLLSEKYADVDYFPAYEILMDDLRDYRFYAADMIHPSDEAEKYIWEKFIEKYVDEPTSDFIEKWKHVQRALHHKPFHLQSAAHQDFLKKTLQQLHAFRAIVNVDTEINVIQGQLNSPS